MPDGIEVVLSGSGSLTWTIMGHPAENDGMVQVSNLDGSNVRNIFNFGEIHTAKQLAIDPMSHKLYVCDRDGLRVHRANLDGISKEVLIQRGNWRHSDE